MGGGASAPRDNYVCRVADGSGGSMESRSGGGKASKRRESKDVTASAAEESKGLPGSNGGRDSPALGGGSGGKGGTINASPSVTGRKTPNQSPLQRGNSRKMLGRSISDIGRLERQTSSLGKQGGLSSGGSKFKWLLKTGAMTAPSMNSLETERIIGTGLMGTVRIAKLKDKNLYAALKGIRKDYIVKHKDGRHIENERRLMLQLKNPFCIKLFGTFQDGPYVYFFMELAVGGELFRRLSKKDNFSAETTKFYAHEIFSALEHVQSLGWVYRDLKPENVMLDEDGHCKLVDFGFSTQPDENGIVRTFCGTPAYLSPEQLNGKFTNGYSKIVDWWSLGILIYELMTGNTPFCNSNSETAYEIYLRILKNNMKFPRGFESQSKELVKVLCHADINKRLSDPEMIKIHPYFNMPWDAVNAKGLVPPFVPRIKDESDRDHYFNPYSEPRSQPQDVGRLDLEGF